MSDVFLTDIFGTKINVENQHDLPFILVNCYDVDTILINTIETQDNNYTIYKPNMEYLKKVLDMYNINISNYSTIGDIILPNEENIKITIVLVNKNIGSPYIGVKPFDYKVRDIIKNYMVWEPLCNDNYLPLGYVVSTKKPYNNEILVIHKKYVTNYNNKIYPSKITNMNEFNLVSLQGDEKYTIKRTAFLDNEYNLNLSSKVDSEYQNLPVSYTIQGELKINNKCLSNDNNDTVTQSQCRNSDNQKWYLYDNHIVSDKDQSCIAVDNNSLKKKRCDVNDVTQQWIIKNEDSVILDNLQPVNDKWTTIKGKTVLLLESDNPWYINKTSKIEGIVEPKTSELNLSDYESTAQYNPNFMIDILSPDLGHGHSFVERNGGKYYDSCYRGDERVEAFNGKEDMYKLNMPNIILCLVVILIVIIIIKILLSPYKKSD